MMKKRTRSFRKDQHHIGHLTISDTNSDYSLQSHALGLNFKSNSIFNVPRLFVGLGPKGLLDSDSVRSPTSPLDVTFLSNLGNLVRTPRSSPHEGQQRCWDCSKVGLSIIDSLEDCSKFSGKILWSSESKKISLSPQMMIKTANCPTYIDSFDASESLPKDFCTLPDTQNGSIFQKGGSTVVFEIGETHLEHEPFGKTRSCSLDSCSPFKDLTGLTRSHTDSDSENFALKDMTIQMSSPSNFIGGSQNSNSNTLLTRELNSSPVSICSSDEFFKSLSASEIELSEDYTCVISHGLNPKTTHIFGDCILETHSNDFKNHYKNEGKEEGVSLVVNTNRIQTPNQYSLGDFLNFCYHCNKKLEEGKDVYMYRGEKAFCSVPCRTLEIMIDEELEKFNPPSENSPEQECGGELFEAGISTAA